MAITKTRLGTNENGSPQFHIQCDGHLVWTGPHIAGDVTLPDGTVYDVTPDFIEVESVAHALAVSDAIGARHVIEGHNLHDDDKPFIHTPASLTHDADGTPSQKFADTVHAHVVPDKDSSPSGVVAALKKKG